MNHKEIYIKMLEDAGIDFALTRGSDVYSHGCGHRFGVDGRLKEVLCEGPEYDDYDY